MTRTDAQLRARARWGPLGDAWIIRQKTTRPYRVGRYSYKPVAAGMGTTWEEAFADADRRAARTPPT